MLKRMNDEKKKNFAKVNKFFGANDEIENLPDEDRSTMWRSAIMMYTISTPLVWITLILYYATSMNSDILCTLANLGLKSDDFNEANCVH